MVQFQKVRDFSRIPIRTWSYEQLAIVSSVTTEVPLDKTAFQIFTDTGPIALLPLMVGENVASLIWSTDKTYGKKFLELDNDELCKELRLKQRTNLVIFLLMKRSIHSHCINYMLKNSIKVERS